jgi:hypothetical protein
MAALQRLDLQVVVAIRENHGGFMLPGQRRRYTPWSKFDRVVSNGDTEPRYSRELICGQRRPIRYYPITTDGEALPPESPWLIMTKLAGQSKNPRGNTYGMRPWIEYGFQQSQNELGGADFRLTDYNDSEKWWEIVCSTYLLVSFQSSRVKDIEACRRQERLAVAQAEHGTKPAATQDLLHTHTWWDHGKGGKNTLNNLRFMIQPYVYYCLLYGWLAVFNLPLLKGGLTRLLVLMHEFRGIVPV